MMSFLGKFIDGSKDNTSESDEIECNIPNSNLDEAEEDKR